MATLYAYIDGNYVEADYLSQIPYEPEQHPQVSEPMDDMYFEPDYLEAGYYETTDPGDFIVDGYFEPGYIDSFVYGSAEVLSFVSVYALLEKQPGIVKDFDAALSFEFAQTADAGILFDVYSDQISDFAQESQGNITVGAQAAFEVTFTAQITLSNTIGADLFAFSEALLSAQVDRIRDINLDADSAFDIATDYVRYRDASEDAQALFDAFIQGLRSRDFNMETQAAFSFAAETRKIVGFSADLVSEFKIGHIDQGVFVPSIRANAIYDITESYSSAATQTATATRIFRLDSVLNSKFTVFTSRYFGTGRPHNFITQANFDTGIKKFGTASLLNPDGERADYYLNKYVYSAKLTQPYVFETWYYNTAYINDTNGGFGVGNNRLLSHWWLRPTLNGVLEFSQSSRINPATGDPYVYHIVNSASNVIQLNTWNHILLVALPAAPGNPPSSYQIAVYVNGTRVIQTYRRGDDANYQNSYHTYDYLYLKNIGDNGRLDDTSLHIGSTLGYDVNAASITVPTEPRINNDYTRLIWRFDGNGLDDIGLGVIESSSSISSISSLTARLSGPVHGSADFTAQTSVSCTARKTVEINLVAFDDIELAASAIRIHPGSSDLAQDSALAAAAVKTVDAEVTIDGVFADSVLAVKVVDADISLVAEFAVTADAAITVDADMSAVISMQITTQVAKIVSTSVNIDNTSTLAAQPTAVKQGNATIASAMDFALSFSIVHIEEYVYVIPREISEWTIQAENSLWSIAREDRSFIIRR